MYYSICLVGTYYLHVGLRSQAVPIPGSPFKLRVEPGPAHAAATTLPKDAPVPLKGVVGMHESLGAQLVLHVNDKMGNPCASGGAKVTIGVVGDAKDHMQVKTADRGDGAYELVWRSKRSGDFEVTIAIDGLPTPSPPSPPLTCVVSFYGR